MLSPSDDRKEEEEEEEEEEDELLGSPVVGPGSQGSARAIFSSNNPYRLSSRLRLRSGYAYRHT